MARVAIVTNSLSGGGAERAMNILANELHRLNHEITVIAINSSPPDSISLDCRIIEIERQWRGSLADTLKSLKIFREKIKSIKPEIVILNCDLPEFYGAITLLRAKIIAVEHVNYPWRNRELLGKFIRLILRVKKTKWVTVSNHLRIWPKNDSPNRVIYNPISAIHESEFRSSAPIKKVIFMGRLTFQKNPHLFVEIAHYTNLPALVLGEGEDRIHLLELAKRLRVDIEAPGFIKFPWQEISDGDLLIIPSRYEGDGLVVIEALQRNIPLLVSNIPEFKRFGLPALNYASALEEFVEVISTNRDSTAAFQVDSEKSESILSQRKITSIGQDWEKLIGDLMNQPER